MRINFKAKLLIFVLSVVLISTALLVGFFIINFFSITNFSLEQNSQGIKESNREFLINLANDKARLTSLQFKNAINSITVLGKAAQKIIDNYSDLSRLSSVYSLEMFRSKFVTYNRALTNSTQEEVNVLIPPSLTDQARARELLRVSSLLNLLIGPVFESNENNTFVYFVGDKQSPVTRAYPNINLAEYLGDYIDLLFWREFFPDNVQYWEKFYQDNQFQEKIIKNVGTPVTFDPPYEDAAGQGKIITLFYPLWNSRRNIFAGAVAADVSLAKVVENILEIHVAETGFAILINGKGEIIAMPEAVEDRLKVMSNEIERGGLKYYYRDLSTSADSGIQEIFPHIMSDREGYLYTTFDNGEEHIVVFSTLDPINDTQYNEDPWKIIISVPEKEILATLFKTHKAINEQNTQTIFVSLAGVGVVVVAAILLTFLISGRITKSIGKLARAAEKISNKDYDIELNLQTKDEIGDLGSAFMQMSREIKSYTEHLEDMVQERTEKLEQALKEISVLNEKLKDENLRLNAELDVARRLQLMVLPGEKELSSIPDLDIACIMHPADEVGGDYYDFIKTNGSVKFGIGDVTGHGLPAGVIMLMAQMAIKTMVHTGETDMKKILSLVNKVLYSNILRITEDKSMTLSLLDYKDNTFTLVGQHEYVILCKKDGKVKIMDTNNLGIFVGMEPDITEFIKQAKFSLESGDLIVFYTDGVTEAINEKKQEFGIKKLCKLIREYHTLPSQSILEKIIQAHKNYIGRAKVYDDISLVVIKQK
jgi:sigma-B regulation protein RsbU (phosphoserine phosphatase)